MREPVDKAATRIHWGRAAGVMLVGLGLTYVAFRQAFAVTVTPTHGVGAAVLWLEIGKWLGIATGTGFIWAGHGGVRPPPALDRLVVRLAIGTGIVTSAILIVVYVVRLCGGLGSPPAT